MTHTKLIILSRSFELSTKTSMNAYSVLRKCIGGEEAAKDQKNQQIVQSELTKNVKSYNIISN